MKILEVRDEEAIEMLADLLDPIVELATDADFVRCVETGQRSKAIKFALKRHPREIREIMAICEGVPFEEYHPAIYELPAKILQILNHPDIAKLFTTQVQTAAVDSGLAMGTTTAKNE